MNVLNIFSVLPLLILRDRDTDRNGTLDERLYATMDYFNGTAVLNTSGAVLERYAYSAFGVRRIMNADFTPRSTSSYAWDFGFQGQFRDSETGWCNYDFRYYVPEMGRWINRDPIGEYGGTNLYLFANNKSVNQPDLFGLWGGGALIIAAAVTAAEAALNLCPGQFKCKEGCESCCTTAFGIGSAAVTAGYVFALGTECVAAALIGPWGALACIAVYTALNVGAFFNLSEDYESCLAECREKPNKEFPDCCKEE